MNPLVSIIIPTYNRANDLKRALQSVFGQTFSDWEILVVDNHSTDDTVNKLKEHNVTILRSTLPYRIYKWAFKQFLVHEYGENRWSLYVDIDELWEYPSQDQLSLDKYFQYLDQHSYNAVMSIMLDLFADIPLKDLHSLKNRALKDTYTFYDNSALNISPYRKAYNMVNHPGTAHFRGGIHDLIFGIDVIYLSKIPLIKWNKTISVHETSHTSTNVNIADVSTVLLHYKFVYGFYEKIQLAIEENSYWNANKIYRQYLNVIKENININLRSKTQFFIRRTIRKYPDYFI